MERTPKPYSVLGFAKGYAKTLSIEPDTRYQEVFAEAEALARDSGLGVWKHKSN